MIHHTKTFLILSLLTLIANSVVADDSASYFKQFTWDQWDAFAVSQGQTQDGFISQAQINQIESELRQIKSFAPQFAKAHDPSSWGSGFHRISLGISTAAQAQILKNATNRKADQEGDISYIYDFPVSNTGSERLDALNKKYLATSAELSTFRRTKDQPWLFYLTIVFQNPLDLEFVTQAYSQLPFVREAHVSHGGLIGGNGAQFFRFQDGDTIQYALLIKGGDCPAGCDENRYGYFQIYQGKVSVVQSGNPFIRPFGVPATFDWRAFDSFDSIVLKSADPNWWVRLHVVNVLGENLEMYDSNRFVPSEEAQLVAYTTLRQEISNHRDQAFSLLGSYQNDKNSIVKAVAQDFLYRIQYPRIAR